MDRKQVRRLLGLLAALLLLFSETAGLLPAPRQAAAQETQTLIAKKNKKKKKTASPSPAATATLAPTATPRPAGPTVSPVPDGPIIDPQSIADYIFANGCLPDNFITKAEARELGWDNSYNYVSDVAPGKSIGGDRFGNYENQLPTKKGRQYYECDCWYRGGKRNAYRIIYSNDGLVFYTEDHYQTFTEMHPSTQMTAAP